MTVETRWSGLTVTDWLDTPSDAPGDSTLVRVLTGTGRARLEFAPRPEFGQVAVQLQPLGDGLLVLGSNEPVALYSPGVEWDVNDDGGLRQRPRRASTCPPPAGRCCWSCASARTASNTTG